MINEKSYHPQDVEHYPLHMVVGIVPKDTTAAIVTDLEAYGLFSNQIDLADGKADAQRILDENKRGWFGRFTEHFALGNERRHREEYVDALQHGEGVIRVHLDVDKQKGAIGAVLVHYGGHYIHYYSRWMIEVIQP